MKNLYFIFLLFVSVNLSAQTKGITYQAIIYNPSGESIPGVNNATAPMANKSVCLQFSIVDASSQVEYQELISTTTDEYGMVNLVIGNGVQSSGYASSFSTIAWSVDQKSLKVALDIAGQCSDFVDISNQKFESVPYAFSASTADHISGILPIENGGTNAATVLGAKTNLGLENVDNTSDLNKPISNATQAALDLKEDQINKSAVTTLGTSDVLYPTQNAVKTYVDAGTNNINTAIANEAAIRAAADNVLTTNLATEVTNRINGDNTLTTNLATEVTNRINGDNTLTTNLATEVLNRTNADVVLTNNLATEVTNRTNADLLKEDLANKSTATTLGTSDILYPTQNAVKTYVDVTSTSNTTAINNEAAIRAAADVVLTNNLATEVTNRTNADLLKENLANKSTATTLGTSNDLYPSQNAVKTYVDANAAANAAAVSNEAAIRAAADLVLTNNLATEVTDRTNADLLKENLSNKSTSVNLGLSDVEYPSQKAVKTYVDAASNSTNNALNNEAIIRAAADNNLTINLAAEVSSRTIGDNNLNAAVLTEVTTRENADLLKENNANKSTSTTLGTSNVLYPSQNAVKTYVDASALTINSTISNEASIRAAADLQLNTNLTSEINDREDADLLKEDLSNKSNNLLLDGTSTVKYPTVKTVKDYVDSNATMLSTDLTNESLARAAGDNTLTTNLVSEANNRINADLQKENLSNKSTATSLGTSDVLYPTQNAVKSYVDATVTVGNAGINNEAAIRAAADAVLTSNLATEITNRSNADLAKENLSNKSTATTLGTSDVLYPTQNAVKTYVDANTAAGTTGLNNEAAIRAAADVVLTNNIAAEAAARTAADATLTTDLATEVTNRTNADLLKENLTNKSTATALGTSDVLYPTQNAVKTYVDANTAAGTTGLNNEAAIRAAADVVLTNNIAAEAAARTAADATLTTDLATEVTNRTNADLLKENLTNKSTATALGTSDVLYPTQNAVKTYVDAQVAMANIADADATTKGKLQLAGDLAGTAAAPTVPALALKAPIASPTFTGTPAAPTAAAGTNTTQVATTEFVTGAIATATIPDATTTAKGKIQLAGDLAGTAAAPTVPGLALKAPIASPTFTGTVTSPIYASTPQALTDGTTISWNPTNGLNASVTLGGNRTLSFASLPAVGSYGTLIVTQDATGNRTITLPSTSNKVLGSASTTTIALSTAPNAKDILNFYYDGTNCYWNIGQGYGTAAAAVITNLATGVSGTLPVANGGSGSTTLTGYVKGNGTSAMTANATIPVADVTGAAPIASPTFTGTPAAPTAAAGTNTTQVATTEFVTGAIATATIPDATTTAKGKIQLAGDLSGTAALPVVAANAITTSKILDANVTDAKIATVSGSKVTGNITGSAANVTGTVAVANGGTGATTAAGALTNLGAAPIASPTFTGTVTSPIYASTPQALTDGTTISWNPTNGLNASVTLGGNRTLSFASLPAVGSYGTLIVTQDATGNRTITLPSTSNKVLGSASTTTIALSTAPNAKDILNFYYDGTNCYWNIGQGYGTAAAAVVTNLATGVSGTLPVANGGSGSTTLTGYVKGNGTSAMTANATIPVADVTGAAPIASPTFTGTPAAPTAAAGTNTTQVATTEFVTGAIATATIPDATTTAKGKIQLAGDLSGTAALPVVAANAITTSKILDANVTDAKIATVSGSKVTGNITGSAANVTGTVAVANGGTGATTATGALTNLGAAPIASPTFTGTVTSPIYASTPQALTDGTTISWNPTNGLNASVTLGGNRTLSFASLPAVGSYGTLIVTQDATGNRTITLPSTSNKVLGSASTTTIALSTAPNAKDILNFYYDGTNCYWNIGQGYGTAAAAVITNLATGVSGTLPVANGGSGSTTLTGYVKGNGTSAMTANATIPVADVTGAAPIASPTFTGTPSAPTAAAGTNTTQVATTEFVTGAIATATIPDATTTAKGKIQLAGDLSGTAALPVVAANAITTSKILDANVTDAKIATVSGSKVTGNITGSAANVTGTVAVANGGTGATTATGALTNLGAAPIASPTFTGTVTSPIYASTPQALTDGTTISWNPTNGLNASVTLGGNRTLSFASLPAVGSYGTLIVTQDGTGNRTITLPSTSNKVLGSASTTTIALSTAPNAKDILNFYYDGTNCYWNIGQGYGTAAAAVVTNLATGVSGTLPVANGGSGATTLTGIVKGNGTSAMTTAVAGTDYVIPSGNITGNAANVTGTVAIANGGTGQTTIEGVKGILGLNTTKVAIGASSGTTNQGTGAIGIGNGTGQTNQGSQSVAIGYVAGNSNQGANSVAIGSNAAQSGQGTQSVAIGIAANSSANNSIAIGGYASAGHTNATALGFQAVTTANNTIQLGADGVSVAGSTAITNVKTSGTLTAGTVTYPNTHNSSAGQVLTVNASGTASWAAASAGIPYTGATGAVNLGSYNLTVNEVTIGKGNGSLSENTVVGKGSMSSVTGNNNTSMGSQSMPNLTSGGGNTAIGSAAGYSLGTGSNNIILGYNANMSSNPSNSIVIGTGIDVTTSNTIQLGNTSSTSLKTSAKLTSGTVTYPNTHNNTAGQVLTTDASGVASWTSPSATSMSGVLPIANGGTGLSTAPANGQIDIGNGTGFTRATLTAGSGITITNNAGAITITAAVRPTTDQATATSAQTSFTLAQAPVNAKVWMFINGVRTNNNAYSISGTTVTYTPANNNSYVIVAGDRIQFDYCY